MTPFYADEDFSKSVVDFLREFGFDVLTVQEDGRAGESDPQVLGRAVELGRAVLTNNRRHFINLHGDVPSHFGIVICTHDDDREALARRIAEAVATTETMIGRLVRIVRPNPSNKKRRS
jgi:hypothetical protein